MDNGFNRMEYMMTVEEGIVINDDYMVSSKELYKYLGLSEQNYARWCDRNIRNNEALEEGIDYKTVVRTTLPPEERTNTGIQPNFSQEYLLSADIAQELAMEAHTKQGRVVRDFFRKALMVSIQQYKELANTTSLLAERVEQLGKLVEDKSKEAEGRLALLESKSEVMLDNDTEWASKMMERIEEITKTYSHVKRETITDRIVERAEEYLREPYKNYEMDYAMRHNGKKGKKVFVMARDEDSRNAFEQAVKDFEIERGIYEQNEGQKYVEKIMEHMGEVIVPDPPVPYHEKTNEELAAEYEAMTKMYGEGWDKQPDIPTVEEIYGD